MYPWLNFLSISTAINGAIGDVKTETIAVVEGIFDLLTGISAIAFVVILIWQGFHYKKHQEINWTLIIIVFICLVICAGGKELAFSIAGWTT